MNTQAIESTTRKITSGLRAGHSRNDAVLDGLTAAREIAIRLHRNGFTVISVLIGDAIPTLQVASGQKTAEMIELELAVYYRHSTVNGTPERHGQFPAETVDGHRVRVVWVERGN